MKANEIKKIFLKNGMWTYERKFSELFDSNLKYIKKQVEELYHSVNSKLTYQSDVIDLIHRHQALINKAYEEIAKYEELTRRFKGKLYDIPQPSITSVIVRILGAMFCFGVSQYSTELSIALVYILAGILIVFFLIKRLVKIYGNAAYNDLEKLFHEIDHIQYDKMINLTHEIRNNLVELELRTNKGNLRRN